MKLQDNAILITGGTSGIGLEMARRLKALGNEVIIVGRSSERLDELARQHQFKALAADLAEPGAVARLAEQVERQFPEINVLINCAGVQYNHYESRFGDKPERVAEVAHEITVNLTAPIELTFRIFHLLSRKTGESAVVNVSSGLALSPKKSAPVYCATKAGLHNFSKALRFQYEGSRVKVFELLPPMVDTPMSAGKKEPMMTVGEVVDEFLEGFEKDNFEIKVGRVKLLDTAQRIAPRATDKMMKDR